MDDVTNRVAEALTVHRVKLGLDIETAAAMATLTPERLAESEAGETALTEAELDRLAAAYGIDVSAFFGGRITPFNYLAGA